MYAVFESGRNNSIMTRIDGVVSFPERNGKQPKPGEVWEVEIIGQNSTGKVNFLRMVELVLRDGEYTLTVAQNDYHARNLQSCGYEVGETRNRWGGLNIKSVFAVPNDKELQKQLVEKYHASKKENN